MLCPTGCGSRFGWRAHSGAHADSRGLPCFSAMRFVYLDEFGHIGPFVSRNGKSHNEHPVFGLAGIMLPERFVRPFATKFLQLKQNMLAADIEKSGQIAQKWEKKGSDIFRPKAIERYEGVRAGGFRLINEVRLCGGRIIYYGREKTVGKVDGNSLGMYKTVLSHIMRRIDNFCDQVDENFLLVVDQHSARKELLECAAKTMYGHTPTRRLISPPFEVESYLNQNMQCADWIAAIVGRLWAYETQPSEYADHQKTHAYFWDRLHTLSVHSTVERRPPPRVRHRETVVSLAVSTASYVAKFSN